VYTDPLNPFCGDFSLLYDHCATEYKPSFSEAEKKLYWKMAKVQFNREHKTWVGHEELCKRKLEGIYKSYLVRHFLLSKLPEKLNIEIKRLEWT
jgi:hypothetical protein